MDRLRKLIMEKDRLKIIEYLETLFDKKEFSTKNIFDLSVKIFLLIDKISYEFKIDKNIGEDSLISNIIKLFNPTNFLLFVSPPHLNNDIQNTFKVGIIINTKNKINDGITDKAINSFLDLLFFFK